MITLSPPTHSNTLKKMLMIIFDPLLQPPLPDQFTNQPLLPPPTHPQQEPLLIPQPQLLLLINQLKTLDMFTQFQLAHLNSQITQESQLVFQHTNQPHNPSTSHLLNPSTKPHPNPSPSP